MKLQTIGRKITPSVFRQWLKRKNLAYTKNVFLAKNARVWQTSFEGNNVVGEGVRIRTSSVGLGSYFASDCRVSGAQIGRFCSIGSQVLVSSGEHPTDFASTHPAFYSQIKQAGFTFSKQARFTEFPLIPGLPYQVVIGHDVWIGNRAIIMNGVQIGHGAIVGAGAIVTQNLEPYGIYVGIPASLKRYRFNDGIRNSLLESEWWKKDWMWLQNHAHLFSNIQLFLREFS